MALKKGLSIQPEKLSLNRRPVLRVDNLLTIAIKGPKTC